MSDKKFDIDEGWSSAKENKFTKMVNETRTDREKFKADKVRKTSEIEVNKQLSDEELSELEKSSMLDPLTGLLNFKAFFKKLDYELRRAKRYKRPLSLMLVQLDNLEGSKRQYGAMIEEELLKSATQTLKACIRDIDFPGRGDGPYLLVVFPETYSSKAMVVAERMRERLTTHNISKDLRHLRVTASIGVVSFPTHARDEHDLLALALEYANHAQSQGGDRVYNG
jgi:diguanylate cyclase (GGDEF)-like protein